MIINDNGREYDTDNLKAYSDSTQRLVARLIYLRYVSMRDLLSNSSCNKLHLSAFKQMIEDVSQVKRIQSIWNYSVEEINFYIDYAEKNFPMVR